MGTPGDPGSRLSLTDYLVRLQADLGAVRGAAREGEQDDAGFAVDGVSVEVDVTWQPAASRQEPAFWIVDDERDVGHDEGRAARNRQHLVVHLSARASTSGAAADDAEYRSPTGVLPPASTEPDR
ncbi:hypothetical protein [Tersicoccus sp. Bi-70]|uniref:hypothetical protein n=1 Tax=Tersicoccus sp. Bi-70 TaxID=1897634 RepID=UPI0013016F3E|nr:hypothetical protein [Tersicoccus sp. Bi-70]